ncbi:DUF4266 domain-containing protein [Aliikangiella coralliicola]|uniref:DUF4266 domain-containing protein n=1 Tax=Aliikangiella coralliicola TaxID=2592383 RepID=A0A545UBB5_9GAMM|nr:DUF4266 domain-containing protein [Aliikangiella coralliicola]
MKADWFRAILLVTTLVISGCSSLEPWVKPYERQNLADPIMAFGRNPVSDNYLHHVHQAREAARGAEGSAGGGCGCN